MDFAKMVGQTDLRYWFPAVQKSGVPYPKTVLVEDGINFWDLTKALDGKEPDTLCGLVRRIEEASAKVGVPFFLRTSHLSGKHSWQNTCYCDRLQRVANNICGLVEETAMADQPLGCFAVRELLSLRSSFKAFDGMPVAREFRVFVKDGEVLHVQPYWPPQFIRSPSVEDWEERLAEISYLDEQEGVELEERAIEVSAHIQGFWSVDFAQELSGEWYLIDMARGEMSYCWFPEKGRADPGTTGMELL